MRVIVRQPLDRHATCNWPNHANPLRICELVHTEFFIIGGKLSLRALNRMRCMLYCRHYASLKGNGESARGTVRGSGQDLSWVG
jgi:hypothetical protein